jgi:hypothetical protein
MQGSRRSILISILHWIHSPSSPAYSTRNQFMQTRQSSLFGRSNVYCLYCVTAKSQVGPNQKCTDNGFVWKYCSEFRTCAFQRVRYGCLQDHTELQMNGFAFAINTLKGL